MLKEGNCNGHEEGDSLNVFRWWWCLPLPEQWWWRWKEWWWRQWICRLLCAVVYLSLQLTDPQHLTLPPKIPKEPHPQKYHQKYPTPSYTQPPPEGVVKQSLQQGTQFQYQRKILAQLPLLSTPSAPSPPSQLSVPPAQVLWPGAGELESQWKEQVWWNNPNKAIDVDSMVKIIATPGYH